VDALPPRLRKICYWLETARRSGLDPSSVVAEAHRMNGIQATTRERIQREALLRNLTILERLGCLDIAGMNKLRRGKAPTTHPQAVWFASVAGDWRLATGDWRLATGDWRLATGDWRLACGRLSSSGNFLRA